MTFHLKPFFIIFLISTFESIFYFLLTHMARPGPSLKLYAFSNKIGGPVVPIGHMKALFGKPKSKEKDT
jgi:hypothetical protein